MTGRIERDPSGAEAREVNPNASRLENASSLRIVILKSTVERPDCLPDVIELIFRLSAACDEIRLFALIEKVRR